jgi:predicted permease
MIGSRIWFEQLWQDARYSALALLRSPGFTVAVVVTLSLAMGASTAIFNVADEALFRPLPLPESEQLTAVYNYNEKTAAYLSSSYPDYIDYRDNARSFENLSAYVRVPVEVSAGGRPRRVALEAVTPDYFSMLRLTPLIGSTFTREDAPEALLSERLWREQFGGNREVLGATVRLERQPFTVVGVISESFRGANLNWSEPPEVWIPLRTVSIPQPLFLRTDMFGLRPIRWLVMLGRRKPGVSVEQAQAELRNLASNIASAEPANKDVSVVAFDASRSKFWPGFRQNVALSLGVFGIAAALVLLLACANVSNLLLERALARRREIAIRLAIGAARARLIRQMLIESILLVTPGFFGALLVSGILAELVARYPSAIGGVSLTLEPRIDARVLIFGCVLSVVVAALFGVLPALRATRTGARAVLQAAGHSVTPRGEQWLREAMVVAQIALTTVLLVGGGLFTRSLLRGYSIDLGFRTDHLLVSTFDFNALPAAARASFEQRLLDESAAMPGIESASLSPHLPLVSGRIAAQVLIAGGAPQAANFRFAGAGFFRTMGIRISAGREFVAGDRSARVAIVSEDLAARLWGAADPIGRTVKVQRGNNTSMELEVVGVAPALRASSVWEEPQPQIYLPSEPTSTHFWIVRTRSDPAGYLPAVREFWGRTAPEISLWDLRTGDEVMAGALAPQRLAASLFAAFGLLAVTLASIGLYSLTACSVARRTREIGIRIAIGAEPRAMVGRIMVRALLLTSLGLVTGLAAAVKLGELASPLVREVSPNDGVTFLIVMLSVLAISGFATLVPASRAARVDPMHALRSE